MEKREKIYSLHRYIDANGVPDFEKIFSEGESKFWINRHLDSGLKRIWRNQPELVRKVVKKHIDGCQKCKDNFEDKNKESKERELPL